MSENLNPGTTSWRNLRDLCKVSRSDVVNMKVLSLISGFLKGERIEPPKRSVFWYSSHSLLAYQLLSRQPFVSYMQCYSSFFVNYLKIPHWSWDQTSEFNISNHSCFGFWMSSFPVCIRMGHLLAPPWPRSQSSGKAESRHKQQHWQCHAVQVFWYRG